MPQPALSVIIACRNAEATLATQLSALSQQIVDTSWDVIICDNGSTDGTVSVAMSFQERLPALTVIDASAYPGAGYARNAGAAHTRAPWLAFCDADDEVGPGWVAAMVAGLRRHQFIAGRFDPNPLNPAAVLRSRPIQQQHELQHSPFGPDLPHAGGGNLGVHRAIFLAAGGFDPAVGCLEDTDLCWRIQLSGVPLTFWPDAVLNVRLRSSLRGIWRQGREYGAAAAMLSDRYAQRRPIILVPDDAQHPGRTATTGRSKSLRASLRGLARTAREQHSPAGFLWSVAWHVGHRRWRPSTSAAPLPPVLTGPLVTSPVMSRTPLEAEREAG